MKDLGGSNFPPRGKLRVLSRAGQGIQSIKGLHISLCGLMLDTMYRFGEFALDPRRRTLLHGNSPVPLTPKAFDVLFFLLQNPNRLIRKEIGRAHV